MLIHAWVSAVVPLAPTFTRKIRVPVLELIPWHSISYIAPVVAWLAGIVILWIRVSPVPDVATGALRKASSFTFRATLTALESAVETLIDCEVFWLPVVTRFDDITTESLTALLSAVAAALVAVEMSTDWLVTWLVSTAWFVEVVADCATIVERFDEMTAD
jgi:hypothetical protein